METKNYDDDCVVSTKRSKKFVLQFKVELIFVSRLKNKTIIIGQESETK